jgi:hypothetical protein
MSWEIITPEQAAAEGIAWPDHPYTDPGDGRKECETCGKWVWLAIHSCKGVPVTAAAQERYRARLQALQDERDQLRREGY